MVASYVASKAGFSLVGLIAGLLHRWASGGLLGALRVSRESPPCASSHYDGRRGTWVCRNGQTSGR